jgi:hypothetical protein
MKTRLDIFSPTSIATSSSWQRSPTMDPARRTLHRRLRALDLPRSHNLQVLNTKSSQLTGRVLWADSVRVGSGAKLGTSPLLLLLAVRDGWVALLTSVVAVEKDGCSKSSACDTPG